MLTKHSKNIYCNTFKLVKRNRNVVAIIMVLISIISVSACGKNEEMYEITDLAQYKTDYVGDAPNVINIVRSQGYPEGYSYDSIEIQSETLSYGLTVF